jgi:hypothetical protein
MGGYALPALDIRPPENPLDEAAKALSIKGMLQGQQGQQIQQQGAQLENQKTQQGLADQKAMTTAMQQWDGKDIEDLPALVLKNGGSASAVWNVRSQILNQRQTLSKIAADDAETGAKNVETYQKRADTIAGQLEGLTNKDVVSDSDLPNTAKTTVNGLLNAGLIDAAHASQLGDFIDSNAQNPDTLRKGINEYANVHLAASQQADIAQKQAESGKALAEANLANQKVKLYANTKPGDFDNTIDGLVPAGDPLNGQTKTLVNSLLARGDYEGASKSLENVQHVLDQRAQTNYEQNREDYRAALGRQVSTANQLQKNGLEQLDKIWTDPQHGYTQFLSQAQATKTAIEQSKNGSELASSLVPLMTVLGVNSYAGVHRINPVEYENAGPAVGSVYRRLNALLDKAGSGSVPTATLNEASQLVDSLIGPKFDATLAGSQLISRNAKLDPKQTTIFDKNGQAATLDDVANGRTQAAPTSGNDPFAAFGGKLHPNQ